MDMRLFCERRMTSCLKSLFTFMSELRMERLSFSHPGLNVMVVTLVMRFASRFSKASSIMLT
jgi:hypothetical protein